jgi:hypothetical protein
MLSILDTVFDVWPRTALLLARFLAHAIIVVLLLFLCIDHDDDQKETISTYCQLGFFFSSEYL